MKGYFELRSHTLLPFVGGWSTSSIFYGGTESMEQVGELIPAEGRRKTYPAKSLLQVSDVKDLYSSMLSSPLW